MTDLTPFQRFLLDARRSDRLFAVVSWGCAATKWLATSLNSHPEILCLHHGNGTLAQFATNIDSLQYFRTLSAYGHGYKAAGDVHGLRCTDVPKLKDAFGDRFNAVFVVREPIARIRSVMGLFEELRTWSSAWDLTYLEALIESRNLHVPGDEESKMFVHAANQLNAVTQEISYGSLFKTEDITSDPGALARLVHDIAGEQLQTSPEWLVSCLKSKRVNVHATREDWRLTDWQIHVLREVVTPDAWRIYEQIGYQVPSFLA